MFWQRLSGDEMDVASEVTAFSPDLYSPSLLVLPVASL